MKHALHDLTKDTVRIPLFILLSCLLVLASIALFGADSMITTIAYTTTPALAALLTRQITGEKGAKELFMGFRGKFRYYIAGFYLPIAALALGALIYYLLFPAHFDPNMGNLANFKTQTSPENFKNFYLMGLLFIPLVLDIVFYLGDSFGWQGYLLPKLLKRFKVLPATIILGIAWSIPRFILLAFLQGDAALQDMGGLLSLVDNPGAETSLLSMLLENMLIYLVMSAFVTRLTIKARSCIPALLGQYTHGMYMSLWGAFLALGAPVHPLSFFIAWGPMIALSAFSMLRMMKEEREGRLLPQAPEPPRSSARQHI